MRTRSGPICIGWAIALVAITPIALGQQLFVYPAKQQSDEQLANDRYECHLWAVRESNFDPTEFGEVAPPPDILIILP